MPSRKRKLYKIGHLTEVLGITPRTIRYYDQYGLLPHVKRSEGKVRLFDEEDLKIIQKIRKLQKEQFLPLGVIKERLYGKRKNLKRSPIGIITDLVSGFNNSELRRLKIQTLSSRLKLGKKTISDGNTIKSRSLKALSIAEDKPLTLSAPNEKEIKRLYQGLIEQKVTAIYSLHSSSQVSESYKIAKKIAKQFLKQVPIYVINTHSYGPLTQLFAQSLSEVLARGDSFMEVDIFVSKTRPLLSEFILIDGDRSSSNDLVPKLSPLLSKTLSSLVPILKLNNETEDYDLLSADLSFESAKTRFLDYFDEEIIIRGNYINKILISHTQMHKEALQLASEIKLRFDSLEIRVKELSPISAWHIGSRAISIAFI